MGRNENKRLERGHTDGNVVPCKTVKPSLWRSKTWSEFFQHAREANLDGMKTKEDLHTMAKMKDLEENAIGEEELKLRSEKLDNLLHGKTDQPAPRENELHALLGDGTMINTPMQAENPVALKQAETAAEERRLELSHSHIGPHSMLSRSQTLNALMHGQSSSDETSETIEATTPRI